MNVYLSDITVKTYIIFFIHLFCDLRTGAFFSKKKEP